MGKNTTKHFDLIVVGAGASGMMAAITAARENKKVCIIEKLDKAGKKLLATGNGKCNFTNKNMSAECYGGDKDFIETILKQFPVKDCLEFFHSIGIYPKCKNGYYYPHSEQAISVVNALLYELNRLNVVISYETIINSVNYSDTQVITNTNKGQFIGKKLIIAIGLLAAPKLGSNGDLFDVIKKLGHRFEPILPALCGFYCKGINFKKTSGVRTHGTVSAWINGNLVAEDTGEIQFTDYGLSGIPIFQISRHLSRGIYQNADVQIVLNLLPEFDKKHLMEELKYRKSICANQTADTLLNGLLNKKLSDMILQKSMIDSSVFVSSISETELEQIAYVLQNLRVTVKNYRDFEYAQICTGGIPVSDIDKSSLESKFAKNIHFTGEILDVDGICGGYNLHFAWATGYVAGKAICTQ